MARKIDIKESGFIDPVEGQNNTSEDLEVRWQQLSVKRNTALALSPQLEEWFGKEFPPSLES
jgi:hypothetical protein